ncbi:hypothetical protein ACH5RR_018724 [Cinchona calisaya]|uniref:Myb-like domain-containing protein n=1 Tax=Cinchona calisaya TaxID=153742 RepID=A0ABD2ZQX6_9GENT
MMTGGKVILTYKRQRPSHWIAYKRKRPPLRNKFSQDNECTDTSAERLSYSVLNKAEKKVESTEGNKSECANNNAPTATIKEEASESNKLECPNNSAPTTAEKQEKSTEGNRPAKDDEHAPEGKGQFSGYIKQQICMVSVEMANRAKDRNLFVQDIKQLAVDSQAVLEASPMECISQKASGGQLSADLHNLGDSNSRQEASCSSVNSLSACDDKSTMKYSAPLSANCNSGSGPRQVSLKCSLGKDFISESNKFSLKETGLPVEDKSSSLCTNAALQSKLRSPLITFYRRYKRKKDVDGLHTQNILGVAQDCALAFKGSKSVVFASVGEATPPVSGSEQILVNANLSDKNLNRMVSFDEYHEKMTGRDVEYACVSGSYPETGNVKQADDKLENTSQDNQPTVEVIPQNSVVVGLQGPASCSGNISNGTADDPSLEPTTVGKESQSLSNDNLNTVKITDEIPSSRSSVVSLDLSVPLPGKESLSLSSDDLNTLKITDEIPSSRSSVVSLDLPVPLPDAHDVEDCGIASVHDEQPRCSLLNSPSGSHTTFNDESPGNKGSELLHERVGERFPLHQVQVLENGCLAEEAVCHNYNGFASSSPVYDLENKCLQLFPEDRTDDIFQSTKMHKKVTAPVDSEDKSVSLFESRNRDGPAATKSSLFLGLFLPMELINEGHDRTSTSSQWPNVGIQSKELPQDAMPQRFPDQASSYRRHKMVLDNIVSRARMPKRKRGGFLDLYDSPRMWSEEELDSLWVGIRRYGRGNWEAMLRDPRLLFSALRTPRDLAEQWEVEQSKLYNNMPSSQGRHLRTTNIIRDSMDGFWHPKTGKQNLLDDVQLSLGDVYSPPNDSVQKRSLFNFFNAAQNTAPSQLQGAVANVRTMYSCRGNRRRAMLQNNAMLDVEGSFSANQSTFMANGGNLPHWLREIVSIPLRPPQAQTVLPSDTLSVSHVEMQWAKKPFPDAKGIHRDPTNRISKRHTITESGKQETGVGAHNGNFPSAMEHGKTEEEQFPGNKQDLIIIDSDASSEETISDDRGTKV